MNVISRKVLLIAAAPALALSSVAHAVDPDLSSLTSAVNFSVVTSGVLAVAGASISFYLIIVGSKKILGFIKTI